MSKAKLNLPVIQNWSCHNCGGCCREHLIEITAEEKRRIEKQGWTAAHGVSMDRPVIQKLGTNSFRLAHQDDGACVFLDKSGLCRIHARFGEPAKPLACRVYPYAYHPSGGENVSVSLRFSCPSVVRNAGAPVAEQLDELTRLGREVIRNKNCDFDPPAVHAGGTHGYQTVDWPDFLRIVDAIDESLADEGVNFSVRLLRILSWLELVEQSQFETIRGSRLQEFLEVVVRASVAAQPDNDLPELRPTRLGRVMFRLLTAQYARHDTEAQVRQGWKKRAELLNAALRFTTGIGHVPRLEGSASVAHAFGQAADESAAPASFRQLEIPFDGRRAELDEIFVRYFRVKVQGLHFCGPAHFETTLVEGFHGLALMYPVVMWLGRLRAVQQHRNHLSVEDVQAALATADHNFGYSPALGGRTALQRVRQLAQMSQITALASWYSR